MKIILRITWTLGMEHLFLSEMGSAIATKYSRKAKTGGIIILCIVSQPPTHTCTKQKHPVPTEVERNPAWKNCTPRHNGPSLGEFQQYCYRFVINKKCSVSVVGI